MSKKIPSKFSTFFISRIHSLRVSHLINGVNFLYFKIPHSCSFSVNDADIVTLVISLLLSTDNTFFIWCPLQLQQQSDRARKKKKKGMGKRKNRDKVQPSFPLLLCNVISDRMWAYSAALIFYS